MLAQCDPIEAGTFGRDRDLLQRTRVERIAVQPVGFGVLEQIAQRINLHVPS
jgi:hypothetical protein